MIKNSWTKLERTCRENLAAGHGAEILPETSATDLSVFLVRYDAEFGTLARLFWELYRDRPDFAFQLQALLDETFAAYRNRPAALRERDREQPSGSAWFTSHEQVGAVAYTDRFAGSFEGIVGRIPYLKELGVTWLHLMPFFLSPEKQNDGGYAVSSYRETNPVLGSMDDLEKLAASLSDAGIALVADLVFNHTSDEHEWAKKAKAGDCGYRDFYWLFDEKSDTAAYQANLRDIFPEVRKGSFTWCPDLKKWVWTTFHSYQWDLNYTNPEVFRAIAREMTSLSNCGIRALRLDAVAFIWKQAGTACENLSQAHTLIRAFQSVARLACPSLLFKSEAIVHPDRIVEYIDPHECQLSYNPLLMAELWEAAATREVRLLSLSLSRRHRLPLGCAWVNYIRCHDDIGWTFADEDAAELGIKAADHRAFLNNFYLGTFPGSFSSGVSFQHNPVNGDRRICGTAASLAGVERALRGGSQQELDTAIARVLLLYGIVYAAGGIPLLYLGDELGALNDYEYENDAAHAGDSRWVHRPMWNETLAAQRTKSTTAAGRIHSGLRSLALNRKSNRVFGVQELTVEESGHKSVLAFKKRGFGQTLTVVANFSDAGVILESATVSSLLEEGQPKDILGGRFIKPGENLEMAPCELIWLMGEYGSL